MTQSQPLVSVFSFCKNRKSSIRRSIESVLNQTYDNIEFVIQDGASTDGTVELIKSYDDPRIKLVSEPDSGPAEAFWKVLNRCEGEIIASCLSDEELLPHAVEEAVQIFHAQPQLGAVTRDGYVTDASGAVTGEFVAGDFDIVDYLFGRYCPMWVASFFRRQALLDVGLRSSSWTVGCLEFEIWCRLGIQHSVGYVPGIVAKYGVDASQLSNTPRHIDEHLDNRAKVIDKLFSVDGFFGDEKVRKVGCLYNQHYLFYNHARAYGLFDQVDRIYDRMRAIRDELRGTAAMEYDSLFAEEGHELGERAAIQRRVTQSWMWLSVRTPRMLKGFLSVAQRAAIRQFAQSVAYFLLKQARTLRSHVKEPEGTPDVVEKKRGLQAQIYSKRLYHDIATLYYGRGQIDYAEFLWRKAEALDDIVVDSIAVQASLLSPTATNESLLECQRHWAARHAKPITDLRPIETSPYTPGRKIRVGYYCSFYDGDVVRAMFAPVAQCHDRKRIEIVAYSLTDAPDYIKQAYDEFNVTRDMPDREFVELVRGGRIDIFVEMSGFSPYHRFSAMASRCAPIQVSYFNHTGTSAVPNVDYVFADAISVAESDGQHFTEKVWRLEGDHLFFNYEWANLPEPSEPPNVRTGHITFGSFGSGGKVNDGLIELWSRILHAVPGSKLYIRNSYLGSPANREFMSARFGRHGIGPQRLRLRGAEAWSEFVKSYDEVDISLDTWPYCGANTIGESLWQGVPVITLKGERFSSRYGASHLTAAGCPELIATTPERYVELAAQLAADPERLKQYRQNLRGMMFEHGLSDPQRFARKLERAYAEMITLANAGTR